MIEKLQQLVAEAAALKAAFDALETERLRVSEIGGSTESVHETRVAAGQLTVLKPQFDAIAIRAEELDALAQEAYSKAQEFIDELRDAAVDVAADVKYDAEVAADDCESEVESFEEWADEQEESAPEQLSRRRASMPFFRVG